MKLNISLLILALLLQLLAFNLKTVQLSVNENDYIMYYDKLNSLSWLIFSLFALRLVKHIKTIGKPEGYSLYVKRCKIFCEFFMALTICPVINEFLGDPIKSLIGNYIYGAFILVVYSILFIIYTVKFKHSGRVEK